MTPSSNLNAFNDGIRLGKDGIEVSELEAVRSLAANCDGKRANMMYLTFRDETRRAGQRDRKTGAPLASPLSVRIMDTRLTMLRKQ